MFYFTYNHKSRFRYWSAAVTLAKLIKTQNHVELNICADEKEDVKNRTRLLKPAVADRQ